MADAKVVAQPWFGGEFDDLYLTAGDHALEGYRAVPKGGECAECRGAREEENGPFGAEDAGEVQDEGDQCSYWARLDDDSHFLVDLE